MGIPVEKEKGIGRIYEEMASNGQTLPTFEERMYLYIHEAAQIPRGSTQRDLYQDALQLS